MQKLKTILSTLGMILCILAAGSAILACRDLLTILPADDYEDMGIYTFLPYDVQAVQVQNHSASSRDRRMQPTRTVYEVCYRDSDGIGYRWQERVATKEMGQDLVAKGEKIQRRVLSITHDQIYLFIEPQQTAQSYTAQLRRKAVAILLIAGAYGLCYLLVWITLWRRNKQEE